MGLLFIMKPWQALDRTAQTVGTEPSESWQEAQDRQGEGRTTVNSVEDRSSCCRLDLEQVGAAELKLGAWEMDFGGHGTVRLSWEGRRAV